jgi:O-acetyl-ADP-ribose deacetylase
VSYAPGLRQVRASGRIAGMMMEVLVKVGDVLDEEVDVMISSANPWLNMSGGVNGAILARGGDSVQSELHAYLGDLGQSAVEPGTVVVTNPGPINAKQILHAVAIDPFYDSSVEIVERTVRNALVTAARLGARTVAMPALATGYGHLSMEDFAAGFAQAVASNEWATVDTTVDRLVVVVRSEDNVEIIRHALERTRRK